MNQNNGQINEMNGQNRNGVDPQSFHQTNDIIKVVEVKSNKKTVIILLVILAVLIIIFLVFELPMLMNL